MSAPTLKESAALLATPTAYADEPRLHAGLAELRRHNPVAYVDVEDYHPFWAITKHSDILAVERDDELFTNGPRPVLAKKEGDQFQADTGVNSLIHMDGNEHRTMHAIAVEWFRPKAMRAMKLRVDDLVRSHLDAMRDRAGEAEVHDFVQETAVHYPLYVIMSLLGVPEADFPLMLKLTQELFGSGDDEFKRGQTLADVAPVLMEIFEHFTALTAARRETPTDDLGSAIANARVDGELLSDLDTLSYYLIVATAGHDTTSATISGGMQALLANPDQLRRLRDEPALMPSAVEEMIRWVTPVKAFMRTAAADTTVRGVPIAAGESVLLSYVAANRDEEAFDEPDRFDIAREPNKHVAFGFGVHFCLGAALARMEINSFFTGLLPRLVSMEPAGDPQWMATTFVGGLKHLPVSYRLT